MLMVDKIVKEHNTQPEKVYVMNYIDCLNWLAMYNEKERHIKQLEKQK